MWRCSRHKLEEEQEKLHNDCGHRGAEEGKQSNQKRGKAEVQDRLLVASGRMKLAEKKAVLQTIAENIEMEVISSEEPHEITTQEEEEEEEHSFQQTCMGHPLVPDCKENPEAQIQIQTQPRQQAKPKTKSHICEDPEPCPLVVSFTEIIEMEVFPPIRACEAELEEMKSADPSIMTLLSPNKASRLKWKRLTPQKTGLVVKDVVCLPRGHCMAQQDRHIIPRSKERAALAANGITARISIDYSWSANQMESRLVMLFRGRFVKRGGRRFSFTYLQCLQNSRVLFVPDPPAEGWSVEQVLRISEHGALYILSNYDYPRAESETSAGATPVVNRKGFCPGVSTESCQDEDSQLMRQIQPRVCRIQQEIRQCL